MAMATGKVKVWMEERGMGFITPDDGGADLFVHRTELADGQCLIVGATVIFEDAWDAAKGKRLARKVSGASPGLGGGCAPMMAQAPSLAAGSAAPPMALALPQASPGGFLTGTVKAWYEARGMGFIGVEDGSADVFVHRSSLLDGQYLVPGSQVVFEDSYDPAKGKRCALNVQGAASGNPPPAMPATPGMPGLSAMPAMPAMPSMPSMPAAVGTGAMPVAAALAGMPAGLGGRQTAVVKSWVEARGMGFVAPVHGGEDLFVHRTFIIDANCLVVGSTITYDEVWDEVKGKRTAKNVCTGIPPGCGMGASAAPAAPPGLSTGTVKTWLDDRGMGFIKPDDGTADLFIHRSDLQDGDCLIAGARVSYMPGIDPNKGKPFATQCYGAVNGGRGAGGKGGGGMAPISGATLSQGGSVKTWFDDKGFGFIVPDTGGPDVMVHRRDMQEGIQMWQGMRVRFEAAWDAASGKLKTTMCAPEGVAWQASAGGASAAFAAPSVGGKSGDVHPSDNLFVAGLPLDITEERLRQIFTPYGVVASIKMLANSGKGDTAALMRMADANVAKWLVDHMNGNMPVGLSAPLTVMFARSGGGKGGGGFGKAFGGAPAGFASVDVRSAPYAPQPSSPGFGAPQLAIAAAPVAGSFAPALGDPTAAAGMAIDPSVAQAQAFQAMTAMAPA